MAKHHSSTLIKAPRAVVGSHVLQPNHMADILGFSRPTVSEDWPEVGSRMAFSVPGLQMVRTEMLVTVHQPPERLECDLEGIIRGRLRLHVLEEALNTRLEVEFEYALLGGNILNSLLDPILEQRADTMIQGVIDRLKGLAESEVPRIRVRF